MYNIDFVYAELHFIYSRSWASLSLKGNKEAPCLVCTFYPFDTDVTDEAVTEIFFFMDKNHLLSKLVSSKENGLGTKLGLLKNKSKTCLLKYHLLRAFCIKWGAVWISPKGKVCILVIAFSPQ